MSEHGEMELTDAQEKHLRQCFNDLDADGSGRLDKCETANLLQLIGLNPTEKKVDKLIAKVDEDGDGKLDYEEYKALVVPEIHKAMQKMRKAFEDAFKTFDKDESGKIDRKEFRECLQNNGNDKMSDEECDELFNDVDCDDDGKIDMEEMINLFCAALDAFAQQEAQEADS